MQKSRCSAPITFVECKKTSKQGAAHQNPCNNNNNKVLNTQYLQQDNNNKEQYAEHTIFAARTTLKINEVQSTDNICSKHSNRSNEVQCTDNLCRM